MKMRTLQNSAFGTIETPFMFTGRKILNHKHVHTYVLCIEFFKEDSKNK